MKHILNKILGTEDLSVPQWPGSWRRGIGNASLEQSAIVAVFTLIGHIISLDGGDRKNSHKELLLVIRRGFRFRQNDELVALAAVVQGARPTTDIGKLARHFREALKHNRTLVELLFSTCAHFATIDGFFLEKRKLALVDLSRALDIDPERAVTLLQERMDISRSRGAALADKQNEAADGQKRLRTQFRMTTSTIDRSYAMLGCERTDSLDTIRESYRALVFKHHPDRVRGRGSDTKKIDEARVRFQAILRAYEIIKKEKMGIPE